MRGTRARREALLLAHENLLREHATATQTLNVLSEVLGRIGYAVKSITFDASKPLPPGEVKWAQAQTEDGSVEMTVWFELPSERGDENGRQEAV